MKKSSKIMRNHQGFSLIELLFAMAFLSVIVFGVIRLQTSNLALTNTQNNELQAYFWANQGMEVIEALDPDLNTLCSATFPCTLYLNTAGDPYTLSAGNPAETLDSLFNRSILIEDISGAYKVRSVIEWEDSTGPHNLTDGGAVEAKRIL